MPVVMWLRQQLTLHPPASCHLPTYMIGLPNCPCLLSSSNINCSTNCQSPYLGTYIRNLCFDCNQNSDIFVPRTGETKQIRQVLVHGSVGMYPPRRQRQRRRRRWRQQQKTYLRQITCFCCRNKKEANTNYATTESFSVGMRKVRMNCFLISAVNVI